MTNKEIIVIATNDDIMKLLNEIKEEMSSFGALNGMNKRYQQKRLNNYFREIKELIKEQ